MNFTTRIQLSVSILAAILASTQPTATAAGLQVEEIKRDKPVDFQEEILPILRNNCLPCHNRTRAKADVILETPQDILKGNDDGPLAVPGKPDESYLFQVSSHLEEPEMPPLKNKVSAKPLNPQQLGLIKLWIQQGVKGEVRNAIPINWHPIQTTINNPIYAVALSADGQFAAAGRSNRIDLYHIPSGTHVGELVDAKLPQGNLYKEKPAHLDFVTALAFSPDGRTLSSGSYREIKFWKLQDPKAHKEFNLPVTEAPVSISPDGKWLATAQDKTVQIWNLAKGQKLRDLKGQLAKVVSLAFSSDSAKILSGAEDGTLQSWQVTDGKPSAKAQMAGKPIASVAYLAEGKRLVSGHNDNLIRTWEARTAEDVQKLQLARDDVGKALDAVNKEIETVGKTAAVAEKGRKDAENAFKADENAFKQAAQNAGEDKAPVNKARTAMDQAKKTLQEKTKQATDTKTAAEKVKADKLEPAKKKLSEAQTALDRSGEFKMVRELKSHSQPVTHLTTLAANANQVLSGSKDGQAILWDTSNGSATRRFALGKPISSIAVSPDGKKFATAGDITFRLWAENGQQVAESKGNRYALESVAFAETEAKFTVGELKYREGELKKREDEKKKADDRLKKANEAKDKAAKQPVAEKKAELEKQEKDQDVLEKEIVDTDKVIEETQKKYDEAEKVRKETEAGYKDAESKVKQPATLETQANQVRDQKKRLLDDKQRARDNIVNSQLNPSKKKVEQAKNATAAAEKKLKETEDAHKAATSETDKAKQAREAAEKAAIMAEALAKKTQDNPNKSEPEKQKARQDAEAKRKTATQAKAAHENLVNSKLNPSKQKLVAAEKALSDSKVKTQMTEKGLAAVQARLKVAEEGFAAADKVHKETEKKAVDAKAAADKVRAVQNAAKKTLDAKTKFATETKTTLDKLKKEKQEPAKKKLADLKKKIDNSRKEFDKINGPLQTAIRELDNANLDLDRAKTELDKANKFKEAASKVKQKQEEAFTAAKESATASEKPIASVTFSPDGKTIASTGEDQKLHTWGAEKGRAFNVFGNLGQPGRLVTYAPDGSLVSVSNDGKVRIWNTRTEFKLDKSIGSAVGESPIIDRVTSLDYSPDGKTLASGGGDPSRSGEILLWNVGDGKLKLDLSGIHSDSVLDIDFSPDGSHIATASADKFVKVTDTAKGSVVRAFEGHTHHVMGVSWRRTGREILSSGADNDIKYWNFENGDRLGKGGGFQKEVTSVHFIGITSEAIATSAEGKVSVIRSGNKIAQASSMPSATKYVHASDVTPDGKLVAAGGQDGILRIWTIQDRKLIHEFKPPQPENPTVAEAK